jgi:hypothetical protein
MSWLPFANPLGGEKPRPTKHFEAGSVFIVRVASVGCAAAGAASSAPTEYCYGNTFGRRKREQAPALHRIAARLRLEIGGAREVKAKAELQRLKPLGFRRLYVVAKATTHKAFSSG